MEYGICNLAVVPLRAEASDRSEQVSQCYLAKLLKF
jgi:hypothetical protein